MFFMYSSPVGTFQIRQQSDDEFGLFIENKLVGTYHSPQEAVEHVGKAWDMHYQNAGVFDFSRWEKWRAG